MLAADVSGKWSRMHVACTCLRLCTASVLTSETGRGGGGLPWVCAVKREIVASLWNQKYMGLFWLHCPL